MTPAEAAVVVAPLTDAGVTVGDRVADVGVPEDRVARLHLRNRDQACHQRLVPLGADAERAIAVAARSKSA